MIQNFSLHTHTTFSDGTNSISEMVAQAKKLGWRAIGISDHLSIHPTLTKGYTYFSSFQEALEPVKKHIAAIRQVGEENPEIKVYAGFEVDYFPIPGWMDEFREFKQKIDVDYLINGNHQVTNEDGTEVYEIYHFQRYGLSEAQNKELFRNHFNNIRKAVESGEFTFLAHIDFARWSGVIDKFDFTNEIKGIVTALKAQKMPTEINTKGKNSIGSFYPARWIIEDLVKNSIPLVISDDAHSVSQLGQYFNEAEDLLAQLSTAKRWSL